MNKTFKSYIIGWLTALALFNVIIFAIPSDKKDMDELYWIAYAFITVGFLIQLACTYCACKGDSKVKSFYGLSLFTVSTSSLITILIAGVACMLIPGIPTWLGIIICAIVLALNIFAVVKYSVAYSAVTKVDEEVKEQTMFVRMLTVDAQVVESKASGELKAIAHKVYEAVRYSDPMSNALLSPIEARMATALEAFSQAVGENDVEKATAEGEALLLLIEERNAKCKILK